MTPRTIDEIKLRIATSKLQSFADNIPKGNTIEEKYVHLYHLLLTDIQNETGQDLSYFRIPQAEVHYRDADGYRLCKWVAVRSQRKSCDREVFMINLKGAINFLNSFATQTGRRTKGFALTSWNGAAELYEITTKSSSSSRDTKLGKSINAIKARWARYRRNINSGKSKAP